MTAQPRWQTILFVAAVSLAITATATVDLTLTLQIVILAPIVALLGLPHGALDLPIAELLWPLNGWRGKLRFALLYLGLTAIVIVLWLVAPGLALWAFLAYSALHFADDWRGAAGPLRWTGGLATVGAPALFHRSEVTELLAHIAPPPAASVAADALAVAGGTALVAVVGSVVLWQHCRSRCATEQLVLFTAALWLQPLVYFMVYFCALHAIRHFTLAIAKVEHIRRSLVAAAGLSVIVIAAAALAALHLEAANHFAIDEAVFKVVFIGLAALTVPHMLLIDRFRKL
jgi:Brp/Blh family beta-carotene 15,15'-monooxygenase